MHQRDGIALPPPVWLRGVNVLRSRGDMHPNVFLRTFWRTEVRREVFVAMTFDPAYNNRFTNVIEKAITGIEHGDTPLRARRVDLSKTGDPILTDIMDGIAHSIMVLADVSIVGRDAVSNRKFRNANVLYEVGLALACRHPSEVLLIRDDYEDFLFDVSTVPHKNLNFTDEAGATEQLRNVNRPGIIGERLV